MTSHGATEQALTADDLQEIRDTLLKYALYFDTRDVASLLDVFTPDAVWESPYSGRRSGRSELEDFFVAADNALEASSHFVGDLLVLDHDGSSVRCVSYFRSDVVYRSDGEQPPSDYHLDVGYYEDEVVREGNAWRIRRRTIHLLMPTRQVAFERVRPALPDA